MSEYTRINKLKRLAKTEQRYNEEKYYRSLGWQLAMEDRIRRAKLKLGL